MHRDHRQHAWSTPTSSAHPLAPPSTATTPRWPTSTHRRCQRSSTTITGNSSYHYVPCMNVVISPIFVDFLGHRVASRASPEFRLSPATSAASASLRATVPRFQNSPKPLRAAVPPWTVATLPLLHQQHCAGAREEEDDCSGYCSFILFF